MWKILGFSTFNVVLPSGAAAGPPLVCTISVKRSPAMAYLSDIDDTFGDTTTSQPRTPGQAKVHLGPRYMQPFPCRDLQNVPLGISCRRPSQKSAGTGELVEPGRPVARA